MSLGIRRGANAKVLADRAQQLGERLRLPDRYRGGTVERWVNYWKQLGADYRQVLVDTGDDCRARPVRAALIGALLAGVGYLYKTNPSANGFDDQLLSWQAEMCTVGTAVRSRPAYQHLHALTTLRQEKALTSLDLGVCTLVFRRDFEPSFGMYKASCEYLQPGYLDYLRERLVDVGVAGRWLRLSEKLKEFDVNPEEWQE